LMVSMARLLRELLRGAILALRRPDELSGTHHLSADARRPLRSFSALSAVRGSGGPSC